MTNILISLIDKQESHTFIELTDGKSFASVTAGNAGMVTVRTQTQKKLRRIPVGRCFMSWEAAEAAYKSGFMKAAIRTARDAI